MALLKHFNRLKYIDYMVKLKCTGGLEAFAKKNNLCRRALAEIISEMKEMGFPIKFDRNRNTYYYNEEGKLVEKLFIKSDDLLKESDFGLTVKEDLCYSEDNIFKKCESH